MPIDRKPLQDLRVQESISPSAAPTSTYSRPNIAQPELAPLVDLAPLSKTLQGFLLSRAEQDAKKSAARAETLFADPSQQATALGLQAPIEGTPEEQAEVLKRRFHDLAERGEIPEAASPAFQVRFAELSAQKAVSAYRDRLMSRVNEASRLVDPQTGLAQQSPDVADLKRAAWEDLAENPAVRDFFGSRVASPQKLAVDEEFDHAVARVRGQEMEREARTLEINQVAQELGSLVAEGGDPAELSQRLQDRLGTTYVQPRQLVLQAVQLTAQRLAHGTPESPGDPDAALRFLDLTAPSLKVDGLTIGEDVEAAAQVDRLRDAYEQESTDADLKQVRRLQARDSLVAGRVRNRALSPLVDALRAGESLTAVEQGIALELEQLPDEERGAAFAALRAVRENVESLRVSDQDTLREVQVLMAQGDFETASTLVTAGLESGAVSGTDALAFQDQLQRRQAQKDVLDGNRTYREGLGVLERSRASLSGFAGDVGREADALFEEALLEFTSAAEDAVGPNGVVDQEAVRAASLAARQRLDVFVADKARQRQEVVSAVQENAARLLDSAPLLDSALAEGRITPEERDELRRVSVSASNRRREMLEASRQDLASTILQSNAVAEAGFVDLSTGRPTSEALAVVEAQERLVRDRMSDWLSENAPKLPAERLQDAFDSHLRTVRDEVLGAFSELSPEDLRSRAGLGPAATVKQVAKAATAEARARADRAGALIRSNSGNAMPEDLRREDVPAAAYEAFTAARRGSVPPATAEVSLRRLAAATEDPAARLEIARLGLLRPEHLLADGPVTVVASEPVRQAADHSLRVLLRRGASEGALARQRAVLAPLELDLSGATVDPWTTPLFPDRAALRAFGDGPDLPRLLSRLGLRDADAADFLAQQLILTPQ